MNNMKIIFLDIDGTLTVAGENTPPASALKAIKETQEKGNLVYLCTGRNMGMLSPLLKYGFDGVVGLGGAYVVCGEEVIYDKPMDKDEFNELMEILKRNGVFRTIEAKDMTYGDEDLGDFLNNQDSGNSEIERWRKALSSSLNIRPMNEYDGRDIYKIVIMALKDEQLNEAREKFSNRYNFAIQDVKEHACVNGDLMNLAFDKGQAIRRVCEHLNVDIKDTYGFGDSMNDKEMIETVGVSVCMANGSESLKAISQYIAKSVEEDGLYLAFKDLGLI